MKIEYKSKIYNLPDFLIVGAAKSGTTFLHYTLGKSKSIDFPLVKEPHFFSFFNSPPNFRSPEKLPTTVSEISEYARLFKGKGILLGDASPSALYCHETAINNIFELYGEAAKKLKIILILRNPVDRAWSQYWHFRKNFNESDDFINVIKKETISSRLNDGWNIFYDYIGFGMYSEQVLAYYKNFDNVKVFLFEDLKNGPEKLINDICEYLEIDRLNVDNKRMYNPSGLPKNNTYGFLWKINTKFKTLKPLKKIIPYKWRKGISNRVLERALDKQKMPEDIRIKLIEVYSNEIDKLYEIIKRDEIKKWKLS